MIDDKQKTNGEESLAELLRLAGPRPRVADDVRARVRGAVHEEWQQEIGRRRRVRLISGAGLAAAAALAGFLLLRPAEQPVAPVPVAATIIETPVGETRSLEWGGGALRVDEMSRVRLDSASVATLEAGAVYFASEAGSTGVEIRTPFGAVRDIGTQFEVRLNADGVRVRVREGRVDLRGVTAEAGTELNATPSSVDRRDIPRSGEEWAWIERAAPPIVLEGMTLGELMRRVAREKGLQVEWINEASATKRLHGSVPLSPDEALRAAAAAAGVTYRIQNDKLVVR